MLRLPFGSAVEAYLEQAADMVNGWAAGDPEAVDVIRNNHPRFLDERVPWLPRAMSVDELRSAVVNLADARLALARWYGFRDWSSLVEWVQEVRRPDSPVARFEAAVEAVVGGDASELERALDDDPELVRARSRIVTCQQPARHEATLLHYVAANGVEDRRQQTPPNAVEIATLLLEADAEPDALAGMYGGQATTLSMLVSSAHPAEAGLQVALVETLLDLGADVEGRGSGAWVSPLMTALAFGYADAAQALVRRGAPVDNLAAAAGLGRFDDAARMLPGAGAEIRHRAVALAAQHGRTDVLRLLLDVGEDPNRLNPEGNHAHSTPLHQAVWSDHLDTVRLLVERGARLDIHDTIWNGTPLGWAEFGGHTAIAEYLRSCSAEG